VAEIAAGSATEIKNRVGRVALYRIEERRVVLADIVVSRTFPEGSCEPIVIRDRRLAETPDLLPHHMAFGCGTSTVDTPIIAET